jgi:hypothetical protein
MIVKNLMFNTTPSVIHANGMGAHAVLNILRKMNLEYEFTDPYDSNPVIKENWFRVISTGKFLVQDDVQAFFKFTEEELNPDLAVITWTDAEDKNVFELILKAYNIPYHNLVNKGQKYQSMLKIINTLEFLKTTTAKYIFGCDAKDVFILNHPNHILESFLEKFPNHKMLINGELNDSPQFITTFEHESFKHHNSPYRFVNSGVYIAEKEFLITFLNRCLEYYQPIAQAGVTSHMQDQACFKVTYPEFYPMATLDYNCEIFQTLFFIEEQFIDVHE